MVTEVERLGRADALTTFTHDFFQRRKHLFSEKNGVWFSFDPSPNIYRFFCLRCRWDKQRAWGFSE